MKKMGKGILICLLIIMVMGIAYLTYNKLNEDKIVIGEDEQSVASMYYSYMLGMDAGTEYLIWLYKNDDNSYKYEITKSDITIAGSTNERKEEKGIIKSKEDLVKLNNKFIDKKDNNAELYTVYRVSDKPNDDLEFEEFVMELFK